MNKLGNGRANRNSSFYILYMYKYYFTTLFTSNFNYLYNQIFK